MALKKGLTESLEDYLEIILRLQTEQKVARAKDIADGLCVNRGAVTGTLKNLAQRSLINYEPYSFITLTEKGLRVAREIARRHKTLKDFLIHVLQVDHVKAETAACRMEHAVDKEIIDKFLYFKEFIDACPRTSENWISAYKKYCTTSTPAWNECRDCLAQCDIRHQENKP